MDNTLERFVEEYSDKAFHFAFRLCGDVEQAKELVQEAFFRIMKNWDRYDAAQPLDHWFRAVLRNIYTDSRRRYELRYSLSLDVDAPCEAGEVLADALADDREIALLALMEKQDAAKIVHGILDSMTLDHKAVLTLADMQALGYQEIGRILGIPEGTVRSRVNRARNVFRAKLIEQFPQEAEEYAL